MAFRILDFNRLELLKIAAQYPVIKRAIKTAIAVARILLSAGASVTASIGKTDPVGKEINDAIAAAYGREAEHPSCWSIRFE